MLTADQYPGAILHAHLTEMIDTHHHHARWADNGDAQQHHLAEAARFRQLADLAKTDQRKARNQYRPPRPYKPGAPIVRYDGAILSIRRDGGRMVQYNRDDVTTAYLLLLDRPRGEEAGVVVELMAEGMGHPEATRCVSAARLLLDHDIEP